MAKKAEIAAMAGQKILVSGRPSAAWMSPGLKEINNGNTTRAKKTAVIGKIANLSITALGAGPFKVVRDTFWLWRTPWLRPGFVSDIWERVLCLTLLITSALARGASNTYQRGDMQG